MGTYNWTDNSGVNAVGLANWGEPSKSAANVYNLNGLAGNDVFYLNDNGKTSYNTPFVSTGFTIAPVNASGVIVVTGASSGNKSGPFTFNLTSVESIVFYDKTITLSYGPANQSPTGSVTISGTPTQGQTLTATNSIADADGLGMITYQWQANGSNISGAIGSTYVLKQAEVGKTITAKASYTDLKGTAETMTSSPTAIVANVNDLPTGAVTISGTPTQGQTLTATNSLADLDGLGTITYQWMANGVNISGATSNTYVLKQAEVGKTISVKASYTDLRGAAESVNSSATATVANVNDVPTGAVTIAGTAANGETLVASNSLADADGLGTISYQWLANGVNIGGATGSAYVLTQAEVGKAITVKASYTDLLGAAESMTSSATATVLNVNLPPTGSVTVSGTPTQGQTLTATNSLADADGLGTISYQWLANGVNISGATGNTYVLKQAEVGKTITAKASYTDLLGTAESVTSSATPSVANVNDSPTGSVVISGTPAQGQTLTATNSIVDLDGLGTISYQWMANGVNISGATASTYVLKLAEVGKTVTAKAIYTDLQGTAESVTSAATLPVDSNQSPTGAVTIGGTPTQGQTLTATNTLADPDGLGTISYQWLANGVNISGATASTYVLKQAEVGKTITAKASYTDLGGTAESVSSSATATVANVNDVPTGAVTISGTPTQGQTLTATNSLADVDGIGAISYQWLANGVNISGATANTYLLKQAEVGKTITAKASYTDLMGTAESVSSSSTAPVANVNDLPTGTVTIGGTLTQGQTLTAANSLADLDGLGTISYQWLANGVNIMGATANTCVLTLAEVGKTITAKASYTDLLGTAENVLSGATAAVLGDNTPPTITTPAATGVPVANDIVLIFSEDVVSTGAIEVHSGTAGGPLVTATSAVSGHTLTINPTNDLSNGTHYYVTFANGSIHDLAGNSYSGSGYDFTTADPFASSDSNSDSGAAAAIAGVAGLGILSWVLFF